MGWVSGLTVFIIVWWLVLLAVLPWGVRPDEEEVPGSMAGAPARPRLGLKAAVTTAITVVIWLAIFAVVESGWISFRDMAHGGM